MARKRTPIEERFWPKVNKTSTCWLWVGSLHPFGYGLINAGGRGPSLLAHRVAWGFAVGKYPTPDEHILHTCDTPGCVRNDDDGFYEVDGLVLPRRGHLFRGTDAINHADMLIKGRWHIANPITPERRARGERVSTAKLDPERVRAIRAEYAAGGVSMAALGIKYGVRDCTIYNIVARKRWAHVE